MSRRLWTPQDSARAHHHGGLLRRSTKPGGWFFRRRRRDGGYDEQTVPIWEGESCPIVPKAERITQPSLRSLEVWDIDQGSSSSCAVASFANALQFMMRKLGMAMTPLNWWKVYIDLTGGSGGVEIGTVLSYAMSRGFPTEDGKSAVVVDEAFDADSQEALASGLQLGCVGTFGHDIHAESCITERVNADGSEDLDTRNSWGKSWGSEQGWHFWPLSDVEMGYGVALIRSIRLRPVDIDGLPDALA